ncbi:MAG: hypothetical protein KAJ22_02245 [Candidatus Izimaplasma sp.]|nr:hypothetical protein [Candidatus Izimaplasma bacterium]
MRKCVVCGEDLYKRITFFNIFKTKYFEHIKCINKLQFNNDRLIIPITNNLVYYDYLFIEIDSRYNVEYFETKYISIILDRNLNDSSWSILLFYKTGLFDRFSHSDFLILFSLSNLPFLIISLVYCDLSKILSDNL